MENPDQFTPEEGDEFANLMGINRDESKPDAVEGNDPKETGGEDADENESDNGSDNPESDTVQPQKSADAPKKKKS